MAEQPFTYILTTGVSSNVYLPVNKNRADFTALMAIGLSGSVSIQPCYDKYGVLWKWSSFESGNTSLTGTSFTGLCALSSLAVLNRNNGLTTSVTFPSSWRTVQCELSSGSVTPGLPGPFGKTWTAEGPLSATLFNKSNICTVGTLFWTLCSQTGWSYTSAIPTSASESFNYNLQLSGDGFFRNTVSEKQDTNLLLNVKLTASCILSSDGFGNLSYYYPVINENYPFTVFAPPFAKLYTANRFALTGTEIIFENLTTQKNRINQIDFDFDDGKIISLSGTDVNKTSFTQTYNVLGLKTIKVTIYTDLAPAPYTATFPDIVQIVDSYDQVSPTEYRTELEPITLPWSAQPRVGSNDWIVEDNINSCFKKFFENLEYLETRSRYYSSEVSDYFGWLGPQPENLLPFAICELWTWEDLDCFVSDIPYTVTWRDLLSAETAFETGSFAKCGTWLQQTCGGSNVNPTCEGKYKFGNVCTKWNWRDRNSGNLQGGATPQITWSQTISGGQYQKRWYYEPCETAILVVCDEGVWNVNIPGIDLYYKPINSTRANPRCFYNGVASVNNNLFLAQKTQIKLLSSDYSATFYNVINQIDDIQNFVNIKNVCVDSSKKIYILDSTLSQVVAFIYDSLNPKNRLEVYVSWGGFGTSSSKTKFSNPNDIHIDQLDNVWVTDTGNNCVKLYSNSGSWIATIKDEALSNNAPISLCVDSNRNVHILTNKEIRVYTYSGTFLYTYQFDAYLDGTPIRIVSSYNREITYIATKNQVIKFFRNGIFAGYVIKSQSGVTNITGIYHDEFRNLLITNDNKVIKYPDVMTLSRIKGALPSTFWSLNDVYINKEEYVQSWVYTKSFQRMWDNIELFRNTLQFTDEGCKAYRPPIHTKDKMIIGQNEIVTASTVNRVLGYLWDNFNTLITYFDPTCVNRQFAVED